MRWNKKMKKKGGKECEIFWMRKLSVWFYIQRIVFGFRYHGFRGT